MIIKKSLENEIQPANEEPVKDNFENSSKQPSVLEAQAEKISEYIEVAKKALSDYTGLDESKSMLIIRDQIANPETADILKIAAEELGCEIKEIFLDENISREDIREMLSQGQTVVKLAESGHPALSELYGEDLEEKQYRLLNLMDLSPDAFAKDGPIAEDGQELNDRLNRMHHELKKARGFKITSVYGTNLEMKLRPAGERDWFKESGKLSDGKWGNLPSGEIFTTPDEHKVSGVLVLPALDSEIAADQGVDEFIRVHIKDGAITSIEGGESAKKMREQLESEMQDALSDDQNPYDVLRVAEIAFGANSKAKSRAFYQEGDYFDFGASTVEAEKRLGTMHIAFGSGDHGEAEADGFHGEVSAHYDFVIPRNGLTVEMFTADDDYEKKKNGRKFISEGGLGYY